MVFVPTPRFILNEELEPGSILAINNDGDPMPEALTRRFLAMEGSAGTVVSEGEAYACWRFVNRSAASEYETTYRRVEQLLEEFKVLRGEELCVLEGEPSKEGDINSFTRWYVGELRWRETILVRIFQSIHFTSYEEQRTAQRALYRAANQYSEMAWWQNDQEEQLRREWEEERRHESTFADIAFAERKRASGFCIGTSVRTLRVPKGARTIPVPIGTFGLIAEETDLYWMVAFSLPLTDCDGTTWLPHDEKTSITIGYLTEELEKKVSEK